MTADRCLALALVIVGGGIVLRSLGVIAYGVACGVGKLWRRR